MSVVRGLPRVFRASRADLAESLVWDADAADLLWCDITAGLLHRSPVDGAEDGSDDRVLELPAPLASFYPVTGGGFVVSLESRVVLVDERGEVTEELAAIAHAHDGMRLNEGKVDPAGRWVTGSMNQASEGADAAIYSVDHTGGVRELHRGIAVANGFDWTADGRTMYFSDTAVKTQYRASYSADGELGEPETVHTGADHDGLCLDADGYLWSGIYGSGTVVRYAPDGTEVETIELPAPNITSVAFGGSDLSTLFVASARENMTENELGRHPLSGAIFAVPTSVHGKRPHSFGQVEASALKNEWKETA